MSQSAYISLELGVDNDDIEPTPMLYVKWIDKCILFLPMWAKLNTYGNTRNTALSVLILITAILGLFGWAGIEAYYETDIAIANKSTEFIVDTCADYIWISAV